MFCKKCGRPLKDGAQFCTNCGEKAMMLKASIQEPERAGIPEPEMKENTSGSLFPLIIAGILVAVIIASALGYFLLAGRSDEAEETMEAFADQETEPETEILPEEPDAEASEVPAVQEEESEPKSEIPDEEPEEVSEEGIHTYELIVSDVTWTQAYGDCISRGGHLVRINSEEEYQVILQQINQEDKNNIKFWLGGRRDADAHECHWAYEDGSSGDEVLNGDEKYASYWLSGEPSYEDEAVGSQEMYMNMFHMRSEDRWVWNDAPDDLIAAVNTYSGTVGYICEYEE